MVHTERSEAHRESLSQGETLEEDDAPTVQAGAAILTGRSFQKEQLQHQDETSFEAIEAQE